MDESFGGYSWDMPDWGYDYGASSASTAAPDVYTPPDYFANDYSYGVPDYGVSMIDTSTPSWVNPTYNDPYSYDYGYNYSPNFSSIANDPYAYLGGADTYAGSTDPYASSTDPYASSTDPYASSTDPYASSTDPYTDSRSLYGGAFEPVKVAGEDWIDPTTMDFYRPRESDISTSAADITPQSADAAFQSLMSANAAPDFSQGVQYAQTMAPRTDVPVQDTVGQVYQGAAATAAPSGVAGVDDKITTESGETYVKDSATGSYVKVNPDTTALDPEATSRSIGPNVSLAKESSGINLADLDKAQTAEDEAQGAVLREALGYKTTQYDDGSSITTDKDGKVVRVTDSEGRDVPPAVAAKSASQPQPQQPQREGPQAKVGSGGGGGGSGGPQKPTATPAQKGVDAALLALLALLAKNKAGSSGPSYGIPNMTMQRLQNAVQGGNRGQNFFGRTTFQKAGGGMVGYADGGITSGLNNQELRALGSYSDGGRLLRGPGDGVSDSIPARIGAKQEARLADGEFVVPARIVSELGNGSTDAGARKLYQMMDRVQNARRKTVGKDSVAVNSRAAKHLPA